MIDGTALFSAEPQFTDAATIDLAFTLDLLKTGVETYELSLDIGGVNVSTQTATITDISVAGSTSITQLGFRNNNGLLTGPALSEINATFTAVPEPSTTAFLVGLAALSGVFVRRFLKRRA
ncbi:MAG: PEP-CTERM sorting domain-containing protein [Opitutales bacterium]